LVFVEELPPSLIIFETNSKMHLQIFKYTVDFSNGLAFYLDCFGEDWWAGGAEVSGGRVKILKEK